MEKKKERKNKYIPNLAEFYFKPDYDWSIEEAKKLFSSKKNKNLDKIFYKDCVDGMRDLLPESIDLIIADPPFGLDFTGKESLYNRNSEYVVDGYQEIKITDYKKFTSRWILEIPRILKTHGSAYIFSGWTNLLPILQSIEESGLILRNHLIWQYNFAVFTKKKFASSHYHILYVVKDEKNVFFNRIKHYETDTWTISRKYKPNQTKNGTKLPNDLVRKCINYSSKPGDLVLDPFTGNATTQIASKGEFRHYIGFEINKNVRETIENNLDSIKEGENYKPYHERISSIEELAKKYPKTYDVYKKKIIKDSNIS
ncbi:site-specific DNA-methyltransferase [Promethearchaeum syntrophicum]|uniref:Type II methyltransferase n=1 Tax=Promethearchaeum syntrophicum TaxID=2594042 RepID=A0A5B9DBM7_9ARCH|nr:site-specific DNA-methyltransferase [Candidatus Prometheoarchaeum syntrophicum]QEE16532.1 Modification methylase MjaV [Candidatus Prometheoarchaeum syntrophicum]